jgi:L-ascorbate metabolism protein UlaG (beta-lactamase superfamily)
MPTAHTPGVSVTLVGGPTTVIEYAGLRLITDPTFDEPMSYGPEMTGHDQITLVKTRPPAIPVEQLGSVDVALVSHDHWDNFDQAGREFAAGVPHVFSTDVVSQIVPGAQALADWESRTVRASEGRAVTITAVPAHHGPDGVWQAIGPVIGFVLAAPGEKTIYISGDNSDVQVVRDVAARFPDIELALLFVGGPSFEALGPDYITFSDETAADAAAVLARATVIPVHADSWAHFSQTTSSMKKVADERGVGERVIALAPGETATV